MEDLLTIIIAAAVGLYSILAGRKKPPTTSSPQPSPVEDDSYDMVEEYLEETPSPQVNEPVNSEPSVMDVLGKILTGDFGGLTTQKPSTSSPLDTEYHDPMEKRRRAQIAKERTRKAERSEQERFEQTTNVDVPTPISDSLRDPSSLKKAIILREVLDRPKALRRSTRV